MKALIIGDKYIKASFFEEALNDYLDKVGIKLESKKIELGWPVKIELPDPKTNLTIYDIQGNPSDFIPLVVDVDVLAVHLANINSDVISAGKKLKVIGVARGGPVNVDIKEATKRGIPVLNVKGRNADAVADLTIGLLLAETRSIARAHSSMVSGDWRFDFYDESLLGQEFSGKILGLIGFGNVGKKVAERARGFGFKIHFYDPYVSDEQAELHRVKRVDFDTLLRDSDFISIHAKLTEETRGLIGSQAFEKMKPTAVLVNTARGEIVDEIELYDALRKRTIAGAALDVFKEEPLFHNPLQNLDNITLTPHIGAATKEAALRSARMLAEEITLLLSGKQPTNIINPSVLK